MQRFNFRPRVVHVTDITLTGDGRGKEGEGGEERRGGQGWRKGDREREEGGGGGLCDSREHRLKRPTEGTKRRVLNWRGEVMLQYRTKAYFYYCSLLFLFLISYLFIVYIFMSEKSVPNSKDRILSFSLSLISFSPAAQRGGE